MLCSSLHFLMLPIQFFLIFFNDLQALPRKAPWSPGGSAAPCTSMSLRQLRHTPTAKAKKVKKPQDFWKADLCLAVYEEYSAKCKVPPNSRSSWSHIVSIHDVSAVCTCIRLEVLSLLSATSFPSCLFRSWRCWGHKHPGVFRLRGWSNNFNTLRMGKPDQLTKSVGASRSYHVHFNLLTHSMCTMYSLSYILCDAVRTNLDIK